MTEKQSGTAASDRASHSSPGGANPSSAEAWPVRYSTPRLKKFGTLTELTLSGTASGNFETNLLTKKYKPKPKS